MTTLLLNLAVAWIFLAFIPILDVDWPLLAFWSAVLAWPLWLLGAPWWSTLPFAAWAAFMGFVVHGTKDC